MHTVWVPTGAIDVAPLIDSEIGPAFVLTNTSPDWRGLQQTVNFGYGFQGCFSVVAKWNSANGLRLRVVDSQGSNSKDFNVSSARSVFVERRAASDATYTTVALELAPNSQIVIARPQLEIGQQPSAYLPTGQSSGVVESAWLAQKEYAWTSSAPNAHNITLTIESVRT
jgi:hypothetical protein